MRDTQNFPMVIFSNYTWISNTLNKEEQYILSRVGFILNMFYVVFIAVILTPKYQLSYRGVERLVGQLLLKYVKQQNACT